MRILVNALSVTNPSGRHVLLGHLARLAAWTVGRHEFLVLHHATNRDLVRDLGENVRWLEAPPFTSHWGARSIWERFRLPALASGWRVDAVFNPAGIVYPGVGVPQVSFAQNPWALVPQAHHGSGNAIKAFLQRRAYRVAMRRAAAMVFNSEFMRQAYRRNAGFVEERSLVVYQGIDEETFTEAEKSRTVVRRPHQVLCVSVMAPHKGIETVVEAISIMRGKYAIPATLLLVGAWPDRRYEQFVRRLVIASGLEGAVQFSGHVSREELHRAYAESRGFCLMSRCESFGIPAIEAQAFGTPVIASDCCAMPEVEGDGGLYAPAGDANGAAAHLHALMSNDALWHHRSELARKNAERYHWDVCSRPLAEIFNPDNLVGAAKK